ncbi:MAG: glycosyltransferase [Candidatus Omnitrophica bacterium]|nr:glycosyltransferase [Candidatus Omnitrophota bacterium]
MKIAYHHDWLNGMRGGEKCLEAAIEEFGPGPVHTLFCEPGRVSPAIAACPIQTSWLQRVPGINRVYQWLLPLFPLAAGTIPPAEADLIVSMNHCVAKSFPKKSSSTPHLCYCFTPMRYAWLFFEEYFGRRPAWMRLLIRWVLKGLRWWDRRTNRGVDRFVAISEHVRARIERFYQRDAGVVYPPVDTLFFTPDDQADRQEYLLVVSALVPYKRVDLAVSAAKRLGMSLKVIGDGPELSRLKTLAGPEARFLGWVSSEAIRDHYRSARALIFPGEEDFGIVPVEAQACGLPVIALGRGGALETIQSGVTGVFFEEPTVESLMKALARFGGIRWDESAIRANAERFGLERFKRELAEEARRLYEAAGAVS